MVSARCLQLGAIVSHLLFTLPSVMQCIFEQSAVVQCSTVSKAELSFVPFAGRGVHFKSRVADSIAALLHLYTIH